MRRGAVLLMAVLAVNILASRSQNSTPLQRVQTVPMPGVEGRIDHMGVDAAHQRLFVAALGNNTVEVLDLRAGRRLTSIGGLHEPQGIGYIPASNRLFVANGQSGVCDVLDAASFKVLSHVDFDDDADNVRYDAQADRIYVGYGSGALGVLEASGGKRLGSIGLKGHPEAFQLEKKGHRVFVNVPTSGHIAVIDRDKRAVIATWPLSEAQANFPMALDEADHRLFIGCRSPARVLVYDITSGRVVARVEIAGDTDDLFYDAVHKRLYVSCGAGFLEVISQRDADHYSPLAHIPTAPGARTSLFVPELGRLYLAVPHRGSRHAAIWVYAVQP